MSKTTSVLYEFIWWAFTLVLAGLVLLPISQLSDFPFFVSNSIFVVVAITLTRYLFFLDISWLRDHLVVQATFSILLLPLVFWMVQSLNGFITFFDEQGPDVLVKHLDKDLGEILNSYLKTEYRFFGIWAVIASLIMPLRLLYNVWKRYGAGVRKL
jgi:hypothetical protein